MFIRLMKHHTTYHLEILIIHPNFIINILTFMEYLFIYVYFYQKSIINKNCLNNISKMVMV